MGLADLGLGSCRLSEKTWSHRTHDQVGGSKWVCQPTHKWSRLSLKCLSFYRFQQKIESFGTIFEVNNQAYVMCKFKLSGDTLPVGIEDIRKTDQYGKFREYELRLQQRKHRVIAYAE